MLILVVAVTLWSVFAGLTASYLMGLRRSRHRSALAPKILTPMDDPMGPILDVIQWAEKRAVEAHRRAFPDHDTFDMLKSLETRHPELLGEFDELTLAEYRDLRENFLKASRTQEPAVLGNWNFSTLNEKRERAGYIRIDTGQYGRYLDGIGYVVSDRLDLLDRACEVVLQRHFEKHVAALNALDSKIRAVMSIPGIDTKSLRQQRRTEWEQFKSAVDKINKLYDGL